MLFAIDSQGNIILAENLEGCVLSESYKCPLCKKTLIYVSKSARCAHFRHSTDSDCENYVPKSVEEVAEMMKDLSHFHKTWQEVFYPKYREVIIGNRRADIAIPFNRPKGATYLPECKELVIEIQHSNISKAELLSRTNDYCKGDRSMIWIFNLGKTSYEITTIKINNRRVHKLKYTGGNRSYMRLLSEHYDRVFLDDMSNNLYKIHSKPNLDMECVQLDIIDRDQFLQALNMNLTWTAEIRNPNITLVDYDILSTQPSLNHRLPSNRFGRTMLAECLSAFTILENMAFGPFDRINDLSYWTADYGFNIICEILSKISNKNRLVFDLYFQWIKRNRPYYSDLMSFGRHQGLPISDLVKRYPSYVEWLIEKCDKMNDDLLDKLVILSDLEEEKLWDKFCYRSQVHGHIRGYTLGSLVELNKKYPNHFQ